MPLKLTPAVIAAIFLAVDTPIPMLLLHRQRRIHRIITLLAGPTRVIKDYAAKRRITYDPTNKWTIDQHNDTWCLEFLRFTKSEVKEMAFILRIPSKFRYGIRYTAHDALALILYRLSSPLRLKDVVDHFNRDLGWISTVFNDVCIHLDRNFHEKLEWDSAFLTPQRLQEYYNYVHANGEPSGAVWGFIDGTHRKICRPQPETFDQSLLWSGYKHAHTHQEKKNLRPERPDALDALDVSDATCLTRTPLAMAPCAQTQFATAPCVRTQLARRLRSDAAATAYAFRTRSVRASAIWTPRASSGRRMSWRTATGRRLSRHQASRRSCQCDCIQTQLSQY